MLDWNDYPQWFQLLRLTASFLLTAGLGTHAYYLHRREFVEAISPRKWMFWIYSMVFLVASLANFLQLCVTMVFGDYQKSVFHIGYFTVLLMLSYVALMAGTRRRICK